MNRLTEHASDTIGYNRIQSETINTGLYVDPDVWNMCHPIIASEAYRIQEYLPYLTMTQCEQRQ